MEAEVRGRDMVTGLPRAVIITDSDLRGAMAPSFANLIDGIKEVLETTPPEILSDVMRNGIVLIGGGALVHGLGQVLEHTLRIPIYLAEDPLTAVARGTGIILEDIEYYREVLLTAQNELPPK
jgi:rod shape-determining protein MreB